MATEVQRRRGTTTQHANFTGAKGEITIDTTKDTVVVHDGVTAGGHPLAKSVDVDGLTPADIGAATAAQGALADSALQVVDLSYTPATRTIGNTGGLDAVLPLFGSTAAGLVPSAVGAASTDVLRADGTWGAGGGGGGLTSVGLVVPTGFSVSGSPLTSNGSITLGFASGYSLPTDAKQSTWDSALQSVDLSYTPATRTIGNTGGQDVVLPVFSSTAAGLVPSAAGAASSDVLRADGTWGAGGGGGGGGLTSVGLSVPTGFVVSGSPLTSNGTLALSFDSGYSLPSDAEQLTWDVAATQAGTAVQPSALAAAIAGITPASIGAATAAEGALAASALQSVDLSYTASTQTIGNTGGQDAVLPIGTTGDAGLMPAMEFGTITYAGTVTFDMQALHGQTNTLDLTGNVIISLSNIAAGRQTLIRILNTNFVPSTFSFPADLVFTCAKPASIAASKTALLQLTCYGTQAADVVAVYTVQP